MKKSFQKLPVQKKKQGSQFYLLFSCLLSTFKDFQFLPFLKTKNKKKKSFLQVLTSP